MFFFLYNQLGLLCMTHLVFTQMYGVSDTVGFVVWVVCIDGEMFVTSSNIYVIPVY